MTKYARQCSQCGAGMNEGFIIFDGEAYYCSEECLLKNMTWEEYLALNHEDEDTGEECCAFWTQWDADEEVLDD